MLSEVFGYDKYSEITSECAIRATWSDLAIKLDGTIQLLLEVKAIGIDLKESHTRQAVDYSANQGTEWVVLTNAETWKVYKVSFTQPISQELVFEFDFSTLNPKKSDDIETLFNLSREGWLKSALGEFHAQKQLLNRFFLGAMILSDTVLEVMRRELRRVSTDVKLDLEQIRSVLMQEVLKREVIEGEKADEAKRKISRAASRLLRAKTIREEKEIEKKTESKEDE